MIDFRIYQNVILDFDGVILDSNFVKEKAIRKVAKKFLNDVKSEEFVNFFISNNGLPREIKIKKYIDDSNLYNEFLKSYNEILSKKLNNAKLTTNAKKFFEMLDFYNLPIYILSGGDEKEVISSLEYNKLLSRYVNVPTENKEEYNVYHTYIIQTENRDRLLNFLRKNGVEANVHYPTPIHFQPAAKYLKYNNKSFPVTMKLSRTILSLPIYPGLTYAKQDYIENLFSKFYR